MASSLRTKLIVPFLAGALALTGTLAWYTYTSARDEVMGAMLSISEAKTTHAVSSMSLLFKSLSTLLYNLVTDPHVTELLQAEATDGADLKSAREKCTEWVEIIARSNEYYRDICILNTEGVCIVGSNPGHVDRSFAEEPHVRKALTGVFATGEPNVGRVTKKFSVPMAGPIDEGDRVVGALSIVNDYPGIVDYGQKSVHDSQTVFTAFLTPDGVFAAHKDKNLMGNKNAAFPKLYEQLAAVREHGGDVTYTLNGETYMGYAKVEPATRWVVVTSGKESEVLASAYRMGIVVTGISVFLLCLITFVVVRFATGILNSMFSLIKYAKNVSEGDLEYRLEDTRRTDELGTLHIALQRLVGTMNTLIREARKASEMKGQFLANMSHEIRTPLNAIIGMTHLILHEPVLPDRLRTFAEKIQVSSRFLFSLINDILDLSKVEAGMIELEHMPFDLRKVLANCLAIHQENANAKSLQLCLEYSPDLPQRFIGDPLRISQVLNNLLSNAIKFTAVGSVVVRCQPPPVPHTAPAHETSAESARKDALHTGSASSPLPVARPMQEVWISVRDTGVGIAPETQARLFQPFTQADASITRKFGGTGLGLAISKHLVELMGGVFTVDSEVNVGSCLTFSMRLEPDSGAQEEAARPEEGLPFVRLTGKRILVAEDNLINQTLMQELLMQMGAEVSIANNGEEAVTAVETASFDLVFMDMQMPVMDGLEATRRIRVSHPAEVLPVIALTANAMKEDKARCFASGMNDYLTKPIEPEILASVLKQWL